MSGGYHSGMDDDWATSGTYLGRDITGLEAQRARARAAMRDPSLSIPRRREAAQELMMYTYTWTSKEGHALIRRLKAYLKKQREYKRRWRAKRRREGKPT